MDPPFSLILRSSQIREFSIILTVYSMSDSSRTLVGFLFGEGNTNFENFTAEHSCNRFCSFYQLPLPVDNSQSATKNQTRKKSLDMIPSPASESDSSLPKNPIPVSVSDSGTAPMDISQAALD